MTYLGADTGIKASKTKAYRPKTTTSDPLAKYSPNLLRNQRAEHFGEAIVTDITYLPTREGWLYLSVAMDLYSRTVLGWHTSPKMPAELVTAFFSL